MIQSTATALAIATVVLTLGANAAAADGEALYTENCARCHGAEGHGFPPPIPALRGNPNLEDPYILVTNTHAGGAYMPPFPNLDAEQIAAIANYVRGAWGNGLPPVEIEEVAELMDEVADPDRPEERSIWDGVYTREQAEQGRMIVRSTCASCHGANINGVPSDNDMHPGPPLARAYFLREWDGQPLGAFFTYSKWTMPMANPGFMPDEDYAAVVAYALALTGAPAGQTPLPADARELGYITIDPEP